MVHNVICGVYSVLRSFHILGQGITSDHEQDSQLQHSAAQGNEEVRTSHRDVDDGDDYDDDIIMICGPAHTWFR